MDKKRMDVLSNNLSNINTAGYKKREMIFKLSESVQYTDPFLGQNSHFQKTGNIFIDISEGSIKQTGNPFDLSINSNNFFIVKTKSGEALTRNGNFRLDSKNNLVNQDGFLLLGEKGPINIEEIRELSIDSSGNIYNGGEMIDRIKVIAVGNSLDLVTAGSNCFKLKEGAEPAEIDNLVIRQGFLEVSNVNGIDEMVEMISIMRSYEAGQKILKMQDESLSKAVNIIGKLN